jgi:hypothetical protein
VRSRCPVADEELDETKLLPSSPVLNMTMTSMAAEQMNALLTS